VDRGFHGEENAEDEPPVREKRLLVSEIKGRKTSLNNEKFNSSNSPKKQSRRVNPIESIRVLIDTYEDDTQNTFTQVSKSVAL
jgi:hypothetical protein